MSTDNCRRFKRVVVVAFAMVSVPYLWILWNLWTGTANFFRSTSPDDFYDLQSRAMLAGHLYVPKGSLGIEAFVIGGKRYTYFGLFPSLLRMPVLALSHGFAGRLTAPSLLLAWVVTGAFGSLLLWRVRVMVRGNAALGRAEAACYGVLVAAMTGGSVLMYLAASPRVYNEDLAWSVALTLGSVFALLGVLEQVSLRRVVLCAGLILLTALNRGPTGYACVIGAVLIAGWFRFGRGGPENRRWAVPMLLAGLIPLIINVAVNWAKLGTPVGLSEADQVWTTINAHRRYYLAANGGSAFGVQFLPTTLYAYMQPGGIHFGSAFPFITLPTAPASAVGKVVLDETYPTASVPTSMPLLFLLGCWGTIMAFRPHPVDGLRPMRLLLIATAAGTGGVLLFGYIADRYLADFLPFLILAGIIGLVDVWRRLDGRRRPTRVIAVAVITVLGVFGIWSNVGAAITPTAGWTATQAKNFVTAQRSLGGALTVSHGSNLPYFAPAGTLFAANNCSGLYVSTGFSYRSVPGQQLQHDTWLPVEQGPGINHVLRVKFNRPVSQLPASVALMTYGKSALVVVPYGSDKVRLVLEHGGAPSVTWPQDSTSPFRVKEHVPYRITVMADPNLKSIVVGGLGGVIKHYLAGSGPSVVLTTSDHRGAALPAVSIADDSGRTSSMALCRELARTGES
jgi:hypothetical protein